MEYKGYAVGNFYYCYHDYYLLCLKWAGKNEFYRVTPSISSR